ncbi:MAG: hypothetical protein JWP95_2351 [Actinotalea sp.]|nr:hypothetical protein [Actinotalea sp.]
MVDHSTGRAPSGGRRRALSPGMRTFLVIDVILVLTFLVVGAMRLADRPSAIETTDAGQTQGEPETEPDQSPPAEPEQAEEVAAFQMPSGNIFCEMTETSAECTILSFSYSPPAPPEGCAGTVGNVLRVAAGEEGTMPCVESPPTAPPESMPVLEYGEASTVGEMTCQSNQNGVYCQHDRTRNGFSVARAGYRFF